MEEFQSKPYCHQRVQAIPRPAQYLDLQFFCNVWEYFSFLSVHSLIPVLTGGYGGGGGGGYGGGGGGYRR